MFLNKGGEKPNTFLCIYDFFYKCNYNFIADGNNKGFLFATEIEENSRF